MKNNCYASASFGLESIVARELKELGIENIRTRDARVYFDADEEEIIKANLWLRSADRIYIVLGEFRATSFDELYDSIFDIEWQEILPKDAYISVNGDTVRSTIMSVSDVQSVTKKAIVSKLKEKYGISFFRENGEEYPVYVSIIRDNVTVALNTSGEGLNRRGYRVANVKAPIRETLASGIIHISRWSDRPFYDPMCGSGTIAIEAAMKARNIAPGLRRKTAIERWNSELEQTAVRLRSEAKASIIEDPEVLIHASDIDVSCVESAKRNARKAGVEDIIRFSAGDVRRFRPETEEGTIIINPPYAIRLNNSKEIDDLYAAIGRIYRKLSGFRLYSICADEDFAEKFGMKEDSKRKLYNGNIRCYLYQYFKRRENGKE